MQGQGFHRTLESRLTWRGVDPSLQVDGCALLLRESLPSSLYFDLYQLEEMRQRAIAAESGGAIHALSEFDIELERPRELSSNHSVWFTSTRPRWVRSEETGVWEAALSVPIHARYQYARDDGQSLVEARIGAPDVFLHCAVQQPQKQHDSLRSLLASKKWSQLQFAADSQLTSSMMVPAGNLDDLPLVRAVTLSITFSASVALCFLIWSKSRQFPSEVDKSQ